MIRMIPHSQAGEAGIASRQTAGITTINRQEAIHANQSAAGDRIFKRTSLAACRGAGNPLILCSPGFAGIANPLFALDHSLMLYADGKNAIADIVKALQEG